MFTQQLLSLKIGVKIGHPAKLIGIHIQEAYLQHTLDLINFYFDVS